MDERTRLMLVDSAALPSVFVKVLQAKELLESGQAKTVGNAAEMVKISRSAFYKYRDFVFPFNRMQGVLAFLAVTLDIRGVLSSILNVLSEKDCNVLTINQGVPLNGVANITVTIQTDKMTCSVDSLIARLGDLPGVRGISVLSQQ